MGPFLLSHHFHDLALGCSVNQFKISLLQATRADLRSTYVSLLIKGGEIKNQQIKCRKYSDWYTGRVIRSIRQLFYPSFSISFILYFPLTPLFPGLQCLIT